MKPIVSIVIPVYNAEKTIGKCLDSIICQTLRNIEIICVNDCSKDNSHEILKQYANKDERIVIINHKKNMNAGGARNSGIKASNGDYICFVDNDDWLRNDALELLCNKIKPNITEIVASDWVTYYSEEKQILNKNLPTTSSHQEYLEYICKNGFRMLGTLFKKTLFSDNDLYFPENVFFEDNAIDTCLFCLSKNIEYVEEPLYYYACAPNSVTSTTSLAKTIDRLKTTRLYISNLKKLGLYNENKSILDAYCLSLNVNTLLHLTRLPLGETKPYLKECIKIMNDCLPNNRLDLMTHEKRRIALHPYFFFYYLSYKIRLINTLSPIIRCLKRKAK